MPRQIVFSAKAAKPPPAYSQAVKAAGLVLSGSNGFLQILPLGKVRSCPRESPV